MAYEFKRLSDVEVVAEPAESANVLIEENGVIKKVSKNEFGGKEEFDIDAAFVFTYTEEEGRNLEPDIKYIADYQYLKEKIISGAELKHKISFACQGNDDNQDFAYGYNRFSAYYYPAYVVVEENISEPECIFFEITGDLEFLEFYLNPDNTVDFYS